MADLMGGTSTWAATDTADSATTLANGVDERRAEHINGPAAAVVAIQQKLGAPSSLLGNKASLAARLAIGIDADGYLASAEPGDLCISARATKNGWLACDGSAVSRSTYSNLFSAISTTYGAGDGSLTFNLPDFRGRVPIGVGTGTGGGASGTGAPTGGSALGTIARGTWKGADTHTLSEAESALKTHSHGVTDPGHSHGTSGAIPRASGSGGDPAYGANADGTGGIDSATTGISINNQNGSASAHNNIQPVLGVNVFIRY